MKFFPIVGLLIGSGSVLLYTLLAPHLPLAIVALLIVVYLVAITGCLHEDGLADSADGFGGGWEREKVLAIMRDSRIGSYGAVSTRIEPACPRAADCFAPSNSGRSLPDCRSRSEPLDNTAAQFFPSSGARSQPKERSTARERGLRALRLAAV